MSDTEAVARAIPVEFYQWLYLIEKDVRVWDLTPNEIARLIAALSVIEGRVRAEERERAARIAEGKYRDHPAVSVRAVNYRHAARVIAAAIRSGDAG